MHTLITEIYYSSSNSLMNGGLSGVQDFIHRIRERVLPSPVSQNFVLVLLGVFPPG